MVDHGLSSGRSVLYRIHLSVVCQSVIICQGNNFQRVTLCTVALNCTVHCSTVHHALCNVAQCTLYSVQCSEHCGSTVYFVGKNYEICVKHRFLPDMKGIAFWSRFMSSRSLIFSPAKVSTLLCNAASSSVLMLC